jgi:predicted RNA binding protein YcfA (HicA-like mRNA interferase family)
MKVLDIVHPPERDGWRLHRVRGSHHHFRHSTKPGIVTVPGQHNDDFGGWYIEEHIETGPFAGYRYGWEDVA